MFLRVNLEIFEDSVVGLIGKNGQAKPHCLKFYQGRSLLIGKSCYNKGSQAGCIRSNPEYEQGNHGLSGTGFCI